MADSKIEWTEKTWNPITGCTPISDGCANCYAQRMANRLRGRCGYPEEEPFRVTLHPDKLDEPSTWRKPRRVFVCSMGDLFHEDVYILFIKLVLNTIERNPHHTFIILTKRPKRMEEIFNHNSMFVEDPNREDGWRFKAPKNLWLGVTAENQARADERIPILLQIPAAVRFVSVEPMLGPVDLGSWVSPTGDLHFKDSRPGDQWAKVMPGLSWVICGGESGPKRRLFYYPWARDLKNQCVSAGVPFFFKQAPHNGKVIPMPDLDGQVWGQYPVTK